jgi:antitoxin (DNA-binding transcriptional repressor) of toxin-antitoxin stability system
MARAKIGELRNGLSRYLSRVKAGETVTIYDRDTPIAEIVPLRPKARSKKSDEERLDSLERRGIIRRGKGDVREWIKNHPPIKIPGRSFVQDIIDERESGW